VCGDPLPVSAAAADVVDTASVSLTVSAAACAD